MEEITNAKDKSLDELMSGLPNVAEAVQRFLQPVTMRIVQKQQINGTTTEVFFSVDTKACIQAFTPTQLNMKPEGQRAWKWSSAYCQSDIDLKLDDGFIIKNIPYRIMGKEDWKEYGYIRYEVQEDYSLNAPNESDNS